MKVKAVPASDHLRSLGVKLLHHSASFLAVTVEALRVLQKIMMGLFAACLEMTSGSLFGVSRYPVLDWRSHLVSRKLSNAKSLPLAGYP